MREDVHCERVWGSFLLRLGVGVLFLTTAANKFAGGLDGFRGYIRDQFADTFLPAFAYVPFAWVLPWAELALGGLIVLGLLRTYVLGLGALFMLALAFGKMVTQDYATVSNNLLYVAFYVALLFMTPWDRIKLDTLVFGKPDGSVEPSGG